LDALAGAAALALAVAGVTGCYSPNIQDGSLACTDAGQCPRGFECREKVCYRPKIDARGDAPDAAPADKPDATAADATSDGGQADKPDATADTPDAPTSDRPDSSSPADAHDDIPAVDAPDSGPTMDARDTGPAVDAPDAGPATDAHDAAPEIVVRDSGSDPTGGDVSKSNGSPCSQPSECASNQCVDGVCCNEACTDRCRACDLATSPGMCTQLTSGQPHGTRSPCPGSAPCAGACTSASATNCSYPGDQTTCGTASCSGKTLTARAGCNGAGACSSPTTSSCGDFVCNAGGTACLAACASDNQCAVAARPYCEGGACVSGRSNGARCQAAQECASQRCVDGVCCNDACTSSCQACDVAGHVGACWPIPTGAPYGGRAACGGTDVCTGYCNGSPSGQCVFPGSETTCPCGLLGGTCNSMGACRTVAGLCI